MTSYLNAEKIDGKILTIANRKFQLLGSKNEGVYIADNGDSIQVDRRGNVDNFQSGDESVIVQRYAGSNNYLRVNSKQKFRADELLSLISECAANPHPDPSAHPLPMIGVR